MTRPSRVALIGFGAIGQTLHRHLAAAGAPIAAVLLRPGRSRPDELPAAATVVNAIGELLSLKPDLIVECAGHGAVDAHAETVLNTGVDLVVASVGALADEARFVRLRNAAERGGAALLIPAGAVGGLDLLAAARVAGLTRVTYTSRKPPKAWKGTPAERLVDLDGLTEATTFYTGEAGTAARDYPQNANVAAAVALAGVGFSATEVRLVADPAAPGNIHRIEAEGTFGRTEIDIAGRPLPDNPKTSMLAALSLVRAVLNRDAAIVV